jgi:hypothetical protein
LVVSERNDEEESRARFRAKDAAFLSSLTGKEPREINLCGYCSFPECSFKVDGRPGPGCRYRPNEALITVAVHVAIGQQHRLKAVPRVAA